MSSLKMGFIGVGNIGMVMAKSIVKAGIPVTIYDLNKEAIDEMVALGAKAANSCREVAEASDAVISMVRDIPQTDDVIFGEDGLWEGVKEGSIIIIASTIGPNYPRDLYTKAKEKGVRVVDVGVSKNLPTNEEGQFTLMVSGDDDAIDKCWPVFEAMGRKIFKAGKIGNGQAYKLVNNMAAFNLGTVTHECLNVGLKAGLDIKTMIEVMKESTGDSWMLRSMGNKLVSGMRMAPPPPPPEAKTPPPKFVNKDLVLAMELANEVGASIPVAKCMDELDEAIEYDAYTKAMRR